MKKIMYLLLFCLMLTACSSKTYRSDPDQYFNLLGENLESSQFKKFTKELKPQEEPEINDYYQFEDNENIEPMYDKSLLFQKNGIEILVKKDKIISVKLFLDDPELSFTNYKESQLPLGLKSSDNESRVIQVLGTDKNINNNPIRNVHEYQTDKVAVAIDQDTGKILYIKMFDGLPY